MVLLQVLSDITMVYSTILLINGLGISSLSLKSRRPLLSFSIILFSIIVEMLYLSEYKEVSTIVYLLMFIPAYGIAFESIKASQFYLMVISELSLSLISSYITIPIRQYFSFTYISVDIVIMFILRILFLLLAIYINIRSKYTHLYAVIQNIPKHINVLILLSLISTSFLVACNNLPVNSDTKQKVVTLLIAQSSILVIIIILSLIINVASKNYYTALNSLLEKQVATQISHYEKLEKLNSDMRTFRHDYINHLSSINALIGEGCYSDAQNYIDKLTESTHRNEAIFHTGNRLADAIFTDKSDSCKDFADIEFDGCITDKIENSDICIILANALDNAVEACKKCPERGKISIAAQIRQGYWTMTMRNPTVSADSKGIMNTSKEDEKNHGFGLLSIEQAVKKYDGTMAVSIKDGTFEMAVVLKIPVEN